MPFLRGPAGPIEYSRDALGFPTIRARDLLDGSWARGWFHATDRLIQVRLLLAMAQGRALEIVGDTKVGRLIDRAAHLHRLAHGLEDQVARLTAEARALLEAYCAGFDAGVAERGWPFLLRLLGIRRARHRLEDVVLTYRMVSWFGLTSLVEWRKMLIAELAASGGSRAAIALLLGDLALDGDLDAPPIQWPSDFSRLGATPAGGSNAIAVAATRSASGGALLLGDPHLEVARIPPVLYASHTEHADGSWLQGLFIPGFAWPSIGRTERVAWTYTYGYGDAIDLHAVRCRGGEGWDGTRWRPLARRTIEVRVRQRPLEQWTFWDSHLGTIIGDAGAPVETTLPCLRWCGLDETWRDLNAVCRALEARDIDELSAAHREVSTVSLNAILADASGRVGRVLTGRVTRRPDRPGGLIACLPDGELIPLGEEERPVALDPSSGVVVSANECPPGGARWVPLPESRYRHERLEELTGSGTMDLHDLARFACDAVDLCARRLLAVWGPLLPDDERARALVSWAAAQRPMDPDHFTKMGLFHALHREVARALLESECGVALTARLLDEVDVITLFQHHLDDALALERPRGLDAARLRACLATAWPRAVERAARLAAKLPRADRARNILFQGKLPRFLGFDTAPVENPGGPTTPNQSRAARIGEQTIVVGAAGRYLTDLSQPGGWYCMPGGASERRFGPGYGAGLAAWARGEFVPLGPATGAPPRAHGAATHPVV